MAPPDRRVALEEVAAPVPSFYLVGGKHKAFVPLIIRLLGDR